MPTKISLTGEKSKRRKDTKGFKLKKPCPHPKFMVIKKEGHINAGYPMCCYCGEYL